MISPKERTLTSQPVLRDYLLIFLPKLLKRSTRSQNFSRQRYQLKLTLVRTNHIYRLLGQIVISKTFLKSRKLFLSSR